MISPLFGISFFITFPKMSLTSYLFGLLLFLSFSTSRPTFRPMDMVSMPEQIWFQIQANISQQQFETTAVVTAWYNEALSLKLTPMRHSTNQNSVWTPAVCSRWNYTPGRMNMRQINQPESAYIIWVVPTLSIQHRKITHGSRYNESSSQATATPCICICQASNCKITPTASSMLHNIKHNIG